IWLGYDDGLYVLTINNLNSADYSFEQITFLDSPHSSKTRVYQIVEAGKNKLWIGSRAGLTIINKQNHEFQFYEYTSDHQGIGEGSVRVIYRDIGDRLWLVTSNSGLYNVSEWGDSSYVFTHYPIKNYDQENGQINSILQTEPGSMYLGTYGEGLKKLDFQSN